MTNISISYRQINRLAIPAILAGIVEPLISLTDVTVAGRLPEHADEALGAIGLVGSFLSALIWIFLQSSNAISTLVAQGVGQGRVKRLTSLVTQLLGVNLGIGFLLSTLTFFVSDFIFSLYGAKGLLLQSCLDYFHVRVWGFPLTLLTYTLFGVFRGLQNTRWAMQISIVGGLINAVLDLFFVYGLGAGVQGIAWASLLAQLVMFILATLLLLQKTPFSFGRIFPFHLDFPKLMRMGGDLVVRTLSLNIALFLAFRMATQLDSSAETSSFVGAHALLMQVYLFSAFLLDGYSISGAVLSGRLVGANQGEQLRPLVAKLLKISTTMGGILSLVYLLCELPIGHFLTQSSSILLLFHQAFWMVALMQPFNAIAFLFDGLYKGIGDTRHVRNVFLVALVFGFVPILYLGEFFSWGIQGIWLAFFVWMLFRILGLTLHFYKKYA